LVVVPGVHYTVVAQTLPHSFVASPDVYKVIAENDQYRVIAVTWKPGQRDVWHSHPTAAVYNLTECKMRNHSPDGKSRDAENKAGAARVNPPVVSHSLENIGQTECKLIMFEPK
jgi:mannose-6-phosphate isomerase-like protein (cupin superfamily)